MSGHRFDTVCIHGGRTPDPVTRAVSAPIYMTSAYTFESSESARRVFALEEPGNIYTRLSNPTCDAIEARVAALEGGAAAVSASSGHGAMYMTFMALCSSGDEIVSSNTIYGGAVNMMSRTLALSGITARFADPTPEAFLAATSEKTKAWFIETIANPGAGLCDAGAIADAAHRLGIPLIADNTVATPWLFRPLAHGADIVVHSTSKYLSGNGSVIGGLAVDGGTFGWKDNPRFPSFNTPDGSYHGAVYADMGPAAFAIKLRAQILRDIGACQSPFNAWLTMLGIETLPLRMARHCENARAVAGFLSGHPKVESVSYPTLPGNPYRALAEKYFPRGCSGMFTFDLRGGRADAARFCDGLKLIPIVSNLGDSRTLCSCPAATTHSQLSDGQLAAAGISPGTVRLSVGLEDAADLIEDIAQSLDKV